ncbi:hypothetical protein FSP39_020810 [Pinctada imbricata]|uniref:Uncharacterized protein n=1 Tax=Pinctada imbricata TaxID=66713 RepID=A0AA88YC70_PINIB|nr:hypothetical protein FSP39_020810 [Pinctada imbricata]
MSKRFTESEVLAMTRNKKEEKALKLRLQKLTEQKGEYCDNSLKERKQLVSLCKDGQRTSGYSPVPSSTCFTHDVSVPTLQEMRRFTRPWAMTPLTTTFNINYQNTSPMSSTSSLRRAKSSRERRTNTATSLMSSRISRNSSMVLKSFDTESSFENTGRSRFGLDGDVTVMAGSARKENRGANMMDLGTNSQIKEENIPEMGKEIGRTREYEMKDDALTSNDQNNNQPLENKGIGRLTNGHPISDPNSNTLTDSMEYNDVRSKADYVITNSEETAVNIYLDEALRIEKPNNVAKVKFRVEQQNQESESKTEKLSTNDEKVENLPSQIWSRQKGNRFALTEEEIEELSEAFKKPKIFPKLSMYNTRPLNFHSVEKGNKIHENNRRSTHLVRESSQPNVPRNESSTDEYQTLPPRLNHQSTQADDTDNVEMANQRQSINQRPLTSIGESTMDRNVTQNNIFSHKPEASDAQVRPHTVTGVEAYTDRELDFSSDSEGEEVIFHKGRKIRNYVKPQHRYKNDPFHFRRREKLIRKLATETEVYLDEQRKKLYNVEITFSKASRQRLLKQLVDENSSRENKAKIDTKDDKLDSKIKSFLRSIDNFCNGNL